MRLCGSNVRLMLPIIVTASGPSSCSRYCTNWKHFMTCECTGMVSTTSILELCRLLYILELFKKLCKPSRQTQTFIFPTPIPCSPEQVPAQLIMIIRLVLQKNPTSRLHTQMRWMCETPVKDSQKVRYAHFSLMNKPTQARRCPEAPSSIPYSVYGVWKKVFSLLAKGSND